MGLAKIFCVKTLLLNAFKKNVFKVFIPWFIYSKFGPISIISNADHQWGVYIFFINVLKVEKPFTFEVIIAKYNLMM